MAKEQTYKGHPLSWWKKNHPDVYRKIIDRQQEQKDPFDPKNPYGWDRPQNDHDSKDEPGGRHGFDNRNPKDDKGRDGRRGDLRTEDDWRSTREVENRLTGKPLPDKKPNKDDDHDGGKGGGKYATYQLVRQNGRLMVQYVDAKTGQVLNKKQLDNYHVISNASDLSDVVDLGAPEDIVHHGQDDDKDGKKKHKGKGDGAAPSIIPRGVDGIAPSTTRAAPTTGSVPTNSTQNYGMEQGDTDWQGFTPNTKERKSMVAANRQLPGIDTPEGQKVIADDMAATEAAMAKNQPQTNAQLTGSLDSGDYTATTGNKSLPNQEKDVSTLSGIAAQRNWDTITREDIAKTLAGEVDTRFTDINSEEGQREIRGIISTMENRDLTSPGTISDAIHAPNQYSTWNNEQAAAIANANYAANKSFWDGQVQKYMDDPNSNLGFTHYKNPNYSSEASKKWSNPLESSAVTIGRHRFYTSPTEYNPAAMGIATGPLSPEQQQQEVANRINNYTLNSPMTAIGPSIATANPDYATPAINQAVAQNSWAAPIGQEMAMNSPVDMSTQIASMDWANRPPDTISEPGVPNAAVTNQSGFAEGYANQKQMNPMGPQVAYGNDFDNRWGPTPTSITQTGVAVAANPSTSFGTNVTTDTQAEQTASQGLADKQAQGYADMANSGVQGGITNLSGNTTVSSDGSSVSHANTGNDTNSNEASTSTSSSTAGATAGGVASGTTGDSSHDTSGTDTAPGGTETGRVDQGGFTTSLGDTTSTDTSTDTSSDTDADSGGFGGFGFSGFGGTDGY